jgi:hypothetical protein
MANNHGTRIFSATPARRVRYSLGGLRTLFNVEHVSIIVKQPYLLTGPYLAELGAPAKNRAFCPGRAAGVPNKNIYWAWRAENAAGAFRQ